MALGGPKYTQYEEFLFNLARERIRPRGRGTVSRLIGKGQNIHPSVFLDTIDYCISDKMRSELELPPNSRVVKLDQDKRAKHLKCMASLMPESYYHIPTAETGLPLPITIKRTRNGKFQLYVEIRNNIISRKFREDPPGIFTMLEKSKIDDSLLILGALKRGGDTVRIDAGEKNYFSLESTTPESIQRMLDAMIVTSIVGAGSEYIDFYTSGFFKGKTYCVYSPKATLSLEELLKRPKEFPLNSEHICSMIKQLLYGLKEIHEKGIVHQDLKLQNILVTVEYGESNQPKTNTYRLKICDFDWVAVEGSTMREATATGGYQSPEILAAQFYLNGFHRYYFFEENFNYIKQTIGYELYLKSKCTPDELTEFKKPSAANDIFALGVIIIQLLYRSIAPVSLGEEKGLGPLIRLCAFRKQRLNIDDAIKIFHHLYPAIPLRPDKPKTSILQEKVDDALLYLVLEWGKMILQYRDGPKKTEWMKIKEAFIYHLLTLKYNRLSEIEINKELINLRSRFPKIDSDLVTKKFLMKIDGILIALKEREQAQEKEKAAVEKMQAEKKEEAAAKKEKPVEKGVAISWTPLCHLRLSEVDKPEPDEDIFIYPKIAFTLRRYE